MVKWRIFPWKHLWVSEFSDEGSFWRVGPISSDQRWVLAMARKMGCDLSTLQVLMEDPAHAGQ